MLGNFTYCNPTKLYFGEQSLEGLHKELPKYGDRVVLIYGGGSIKRNGIYDAVRAILDQEGKQVAEIAGVMPNPTLAKLYEGIGVARAHRADLLLAVGGGSVCDYASSRSLCRSTVRRTHGRNTISALRSQNAPSCRWAVCSPWWALAQR